MNSAFGRFVALALLITGALLPVLGQTTHQPFLQDVAALAEAQAAAAAQAAAQAQAVAASAQRLLEGLNVAPFLTAASAASADAQAAAQAVAQA
ncbi:MAG: hypothetical protein WAW99_06170, partial [Candidatus Bipolaricaulis anaerobius]